MTKVSLVQGGEPHEKRSHRTPEPIAQPPNTEWQAKARHIIDEACERL